MKRVTRQVLTTHTLRGTYGGELMDSLAVSVSHSLIIDAEYVFVLSNIITIFNIT